MDNPINPLKPLRKGLRLPPQNIHTICYNNPQLLILLNTNKYTALRYLLTDADWSKSDVFQKTLPASSEALGLR